MDRDYIEITDSNNIKEKMEVVATFNIFSTGYEYIIYKPIDMEKYYVGKYMNNDKNTLVTDIDNEEMNIIQGLFNKVIGG